MNAHLALQKLYHLANEATGHERTSRSTLEDRLRAFADNNWRPLVLELSDQALDNMAKVGLCSKRRQETLAKGGGLYSERITYTWKGPHLKLDAASAWMSRPGPRAPKLRDQLELLRERDFLKPPKIKAGKRNVFFLASKDEYGTTVLCIDWSTGKVLGEGDDDREALFVAKTRGHLG